MGTTVQRWGNSLGVRIPKHLAEQAGVREGTRVDVVAEVDQIVIRPVAVPTLDELLDELDPESRPEVVDWGTPVGKEVW